MKFIMSLVAVAALSFITSAFAQEESPAATPEEQPAATPEEKASATVEENPPATATPAEAKTSKTESSSAAKAETTAATKKETTAAASSTKAAPATAATSGKKMSTEAAIKDMENRWEAAYGSHDVATVQSFVAADFVGVSPKFKMTNRSSLLSEFKKDKDTYASTKNESLKVTAFGPSVAVVTGRAREKGTGKDGKAFDRTYYFTDTWMQRGGQWQCIASQASEMRK
jgi:ketosteroid isomerase-like protein